MQVVRIVIEQVSGRCRAAFRLLRLHIHFDVKAMRRKVIQLTGVMAGP